MKEEIKTSNAYGSPGLLSQALVVNGFIYTSGYIHITPDGKVIDGSIEDKVKLIMKNLEEVLKAAGSELNDIIKATIYVTDMTIVPDLNKVYTTYFTDPLPVREAVCVKELPLGANIEISVVALKKENQS